MVVASKSTPRLPTTVGSVMTIAQHAHSTHNADDTVIPSLPAMRYASTGPDASYSPALLRLPEEHPISNADAQLGMRRSVLQS